MQVPKDEALPCSTHPDAPHGFLRSASHKADQYVCECAYWKPPREQKPYDVTTDELIYMTGVDDGKKQERALWMLTKLGKEIEEQPDQDARRLQIAMRQWEDWKIYALELQKKLVKYEGGSPMILNTQPSERNFCQRCGKRLAELTAIHTCTPPAQA